jgi:hypothetical protein
VPIFLKYCCLPFQQFGILYSRWDLNPQRSPLRVCGFKPHAFQPVSPLEHLLSVCCDATTLKVRALSFEKKDNLELITGNDPISLVYKTSTSPLMLNKRLKIVLDWSVTIRLSSRYQRDAFPIKLQSN